MQKGQNPQSGYAVCSRYTTLVQKGQTHRVGYTVDTQYAVDVGAKRSTHTVDLANMGGEDCYL